MFGLLSVLRFLCYGDFGRIDSGTNSGKGAGSILGLSTEVVGIVLDALPVVI